MGKKKKKKKKKKEIAKRVRKRKVLKKAFPFKLIATRRNADMPWKNETHEFEGNFKLEVKGNGKVYNISIDEVNKCLQVTCMDKTLFVQPLSTTSILIK